MRLTRGKDTVAWAERRYKMWCNAERTCVNPFELTFVPARIGSRTMPVFLVERTRDSAPEPRGHERHAVGKALLTSQNTVGKRGKRFMEHEAEGLPDNPRPGRPQR
jgi:hypothetical protein